MNFLLRLLCRKPYYRGHIVGADGSIYMERWALFETRWLRARIHRILREDRDPHMHDHPWNFLSVVLSGWYWEARPATINPCFGSFGDPDREEYTITTRRAGSFALRRATDRHQIVEVSPGGVVTLFITGPLRHWWGFFTPAGKVYWREYTEAGRNQT